MEKVDFVIIDDKGTHQELACPECGEIFEVDAFTNENLVFDADWKGMTAKCPACQVIQK